MKFLVAPPQKGKKSNDFSWTQPGEPVGFPSFVCCSKATCGCNRSFTGLNTRKATTLAVVGEVDKTVDELAKIEANGFFSGKVPENFEINPRDIQFIADFAAKLPVGTQVVIKSTMKSSSLIVLEG